MPIDCVAGTSMGSIVGGAYATGLTTAEMEKTLGEISTRTLLEEKPPRQDQVIRRKLDDLEQLFPVEAGLDERGISLQKGALSGIGLEAVLRRLATRPGYLDFDQLPIPYRAVATDLVTGQAVVFNEGELASVMRASMSVPGAIAPAEIGGKLLVDGGLTNNLPVDVARAMGAEIVIAVNLGTPLLVARSDPERARRDGADGEHPDRAERSRLAGVAEADRHPDRAAARRLLGGRRSTTWRRRCRSARRRRAPSPTDSRRSRPAPPTTPRSSSAAPSRWSPTRGRSTRSASPR